MSSQSVRKTHHQEVLPFYVINFRQHFERMFDLWMIKNPSPQTQIKRSLIFVSCLFVTIFWPVTNLFTNFLILALAWVILSLTTKPVSRWLLLLNLMLNISWLYFMMRYLLSLTGSEIL